MIKAHSLQNKQKQPINALKCMHKLLVVISVYLIFGQLFQYVHADTHTIYNNTDPYQSQHGSVWLHSNNSSSNSSSSNKAQYIEALQTSTDVDYAITGAIARATVRQQFTNNSDFWSEGLYVFPLPEKAAVDKFRLIIGERIIEGQIQKREQARKTYQKARSEGRKASLIEQHRPNVFTTSLANIAPGENVTIEFEYQQVLDYNDGYYRLRFPMVVGPRYNTEESQSESLDDNNSVYTKTNKTDLTIELENNASLNPTRIHLLLDTGVSLAELKSTYHSIDIKQTSENRYSIPTIGESIKANRDFELVWKPELYDKPQLAVFSEILNINGDEDSYTMLTIMPPEFDYLQQKLQARDVIFVLDISGSMSGTSIKQAKAALIIALGGLSSIDRFNLIWFNDHAEQLFSEAVIATENNIHSASNFIDNLQASGGTEMLDAMKLALPNQRPFSRFRQVVFLTDGNISNETELFTVIKRQLGENRLFTIGIGSAPNAYFMRKAARLGRGTFTYISNVNEVQEKTIQLFKKLETPALVNIELSINQQSIDQHSLNHYDIDQHVVDTNQQEVFPATIPDLYAGETTVIFIKSKQQLKDFTVTGNYGSVEWQSSEWQNSEILQNTTNHSQLTGLSSSVISTAWAREKIASLMSQHHESVDNNERDAIVQDATETALKHNLVSRYTSLVAVDVTPINDSGMLMQQRIKNNLPHGWNKQATSNGIMLAQTAAGSELKYLLSLLFFISAVIFYRFYYRCRF